MNHLKVFWCCMWSQIVVSFFQMGSQFSHWVTFPPLKSLFYHPQKWEAFLDSILFHCSMVILGLLCLYFSNSNFGEKYFISSGTCSNFFFFWRFLAIRPFYTHTHTQTLETFFQVSKKSYWDFSMNYFDFPEYEGKENLHMKLTKNSFFECSSMSPRRVL